MRRAVLILGLLGAVLFAGAWVMSFTHPQVVERGARELLRIEVEQRVGIKLDGLADSRIAGFAQRALERSSLVQSAYASVSRSLLREFRIFSASNALAFALLALVAFVRKQAKQQLLLPALVLVGAVALTGGLYLFNQDWLHTIVFGDYVGWGYAVYLSAAALLLADILMNRARVSTQLVNLALHAVGSAASAVPC